MKIAYCPYCNNRTIVADRDWGLTVQCEAPRCDRFFLTGAGGRALSDAQLVAASPPTPRLPDPIARRVPPPAPQPAPSARTESYLTGPHRCQVCQGAIGQPVGRRRATILHHSEALPGAVPRDNCRTDVYAALYRCPRCHVVLETPSYQWGQAISCPMCRSDFTAPYDDVLHRHDGDVEGDVFEFPCPACGKALRCDTHRQGRPTRDLPVVCVHCHDLVNVPSGGVAVGQARHRAEPDQVCPNPNCHQHIPARADRCPLCGTAIPSEPVVG
jgi:hypothetical protein